jgi:hypothetical protein
MPIGAAAPVTLVFLGKIEILRRNFAVAPHGNPLAQSALKLRNPATNVD